MANRNTSKPYFQPLLQEIAKVLTLVPPGVIYLMDNEKRVAGILQPCLMPSDWPTWDGKRLVKLTQA